MKQALLAIVALLAAGAAHAQDLTAFKVGDRVLARWQPNDPHWYPAVVAGVADGMIQLHYDDGDKGQQPAPNVRVYDWQPGTRVACRWQGGRVYYPGLITAMNRERNRFHVAYDDGDQEDTSPAMCHSLDDRAAF